MPIMHAWSLGHLWSLSVEEQFYLVWPLLLVLLGPRRALKFSIVCIVAMPVMRQLVPISLPRHSPYYFILDTYVDTVLYGGALALVVALYPASAWLPATAKRHVLATAAVIALVFNVQIQDKLPHAFYAAWYLCYGSAMTIVLWWIIRNEHASGARLLTMRPLVYAGSISYGFYLWQQLFAHQWEPARWLTHLPLNVLPPLAIVSVSYVLLERPLIRYSRRLNA